MKLKLRIFALMAMLLCFSTSTFAQVAKINDVEYTTFSDAVTAANAMTGDVTVEVYGEVEFVDGMELKGNYTSICFVGKGDAAIITINQTAGGDYLEAHGKNVSFTDLTLAKANPAWAGNSGHMGNYFSIQGGTVNYTNCTFPNGACTSGGVATYTNCTFQNTSEYGLWVYDDALVTVSGGIIDSTKGIKVYSEDEATVTSTLTVKNAIFTENVTDKPAVAVGYAESITLIGNTYNNATAHVELDSGSDADCEGITFVAQDAEGNDIASALKMTDRSNSQAACGVLVDSKIYTTATEAAKVATEGSNVTLLYTTTETVEFAEGVNLTLAEGVTAENVTVKVSAPVEVADFASLKVAVEASKSVKLTADITTTAAIVTSGVTSTIDLNGKTLTIGAGDNKFNDKSNITIENGAICITDVTVSGNAIFCLDEYETSLVTTLTLNNVNLVGNGYSSAYGVFYIGKSSVLNVNGGAWNLANDTHASGGVFKADASTATLNIDGLKLTAHNVRRGVTYAATTIENSTIEFSGDADEVDAEMEHGFNRSPLAISNSTITMTDMVGRGITAENGAVTISDNSAVTMTNCQEATIDIRNNQTVTISDNSTVTLDAEPTITSGTINGTVNVPAPAVAKIGDVEYVTLADALTAVGAGNVVIELLDDVTLDYGAREAFGTTETTSVTINGNGKTLTLNQTNSDWSSFGLAAGKAVFNNMTIEKTGYGDISGAWNTHAIIFSSPVEMNTVIVNNSMAVQAGATLNNVIINEANGFYGLWVTGNGQTVTMNGGAINATNSGRGIKVADEYIDTPAQVTLNVTGTTFNTAKKAAVLVSSTAGAKVTASNVDITNVAADNQNMVWVDEDWAESYGTVEVTGATVSQESVESFLIVVKNGEKVVSYFKTLQDAIDAVQNGETIEFLSDITEGTVTIDKASGVAFTIDGKNHNFTGKFDLGIGENIDIKNINFVASAEISPDYFIDSMDKNSNCILTITGCNFTDTDYTTVAIGTHQPKKVVVDGCEATGVHSLIQNQGGYDIAVKKTTVDGKRGMSLGTVVGATVEGVTIKAADDKYGIRLNGEINNNTVTIKDCNIQAFIPVVVRNAQVENYNVVFDGTNIMTAKNTDGLWCAIGATEYETNGTMPTAATGKVTVTLNDAGLAKAGVYGAYEEPATGSNSPAYTKEVDGYVRIWGEGGGNAKESYELKLYSGETLIATTKLNNVDGIIDGDVNVTWNFYYPQSDDTYWTTTWEEGHPNSAAQPTEVELYIDGTLVATTAAKMSGADDLNPVVWRNLGGVAIADLQGEGTEASPFLINNLEELIWFRDNVNTYQSDGSNQYKGKYVKLTADIDLDGINWTPIGTNSVGDHMAFLGTFYGEKADGTVPTISNLYINADGDHLGFFARVGSYGEDCTPTVKNIKFNNVDVSSNTTSGLGGSYVAGVIANAGGNSVVSGIEVTGDVYVAGYGYIGGIVGHGYPDIDNCHVKANDGSYIKSYYWCCGGIIGYAGEGGTPITNSSVSGVDIWSAYGGAAAVAGLLQDGNKLENVSASNVEITSDSDYCMGYIAGNGVASSLTNVTVENVTATVKGNVITATDAVASVNGAVYFSLADAVAAVEDGGTIVMVADETFTMDKHYNLNGYREGLYYEGDKSFTIDLGGFTIAQDGSLNDYLLLFKNAASKSNTITLKNGTIDAGTTAYCAICTSSASTQQITVNTENVKVIGNNSNGSVIKVRGGTVLNVNNGTEITGKDSYLAIENATSVVNIYDGVKIYMNGTSSYNGCLVGVGNNGTVNVYGGYGKGVKGAFIAMTSGGTINVAGGEWMANTDGTAANDNKAVLIAQNDTNAYPSAGKSIINVTGGTFKGGYNCYATTASNAQLNIKGGKFNTKPADYLVDGYAALTDLDGNYVVGAKPTATVNNLGATTVEAGEYTVYGNGDNTAEMPLSFVMQFLADQTEEDMAASPYADWYGDFVITFTGLEDGSFTADGCYLAGHYGSFGWVKVPVDGMAIEEGVRYPVMLGVGMGQKYDYICSSVQDFRCALYLTPDVLEANPNIKVNLELAVVDNSKGGDAAAEALVNNENVYSVTDYTYNAEDFVVNESYIAELTIDDAEGLDYTNDTDKTVGILTYKRTLIEGIWNPLYLPFDIELTDELLENYEFADYNQMISIDSDGDRVPDDFEMELFIYTGGVLNANYPYFIRPKNAEACALEIVQEDATLYAAKEISLVTSSVKNTFKLSGTYKAMEASDLEGGYAISTDGDWAFAESLKPHRLYFTITDNNGSAVVSKAIRMVVRGEGGFEGTTAIENVEAESTVGDVIYDFSGRRVLEPEKGGIYIVNGKKVIF